VTNNYRILVGNVERVRPSGTPKHIWKNNIKIDLNEKMYVDGTKLDQNRVQQQDLVNTVMLL
jgi:hypothetical protein